MDLVKQQAFEIFDLLSEQEQQLVYEIMKRLAPDDIATSDDIAAHTSAVEEYRRGETIKHEDINWD
jgi:hypothetical protein